MGAPGINTVSLGAPDHSVPFPWAFQHRESCGHPVPGPHLPCRFGASPGWDRHLPDGPFHSVLEGSRKHWLCDLGGSGHLYPKTHPGPGHSPVARAETMTQDRVGILAAVPSSVKTESCFWRSSQWLQPHTGLPLGLTYMTAAHRNPLGPRGRGIWRVLP